MWFIWRSPRGFGLINYLDWARHNIIIETAWMTCHLTRKMVSYKSITLVFVVVCLLNYMQKNLKTILWLEVCDCSGVGRWREHEVTNEPMSLCATSGIPLPSLHYFNFLQLFSIFFQGPYTHLHIECTDYFFIKVLVSFSFFLTTERRPWGWTAVSSCSSQAPMILV